MRDSFSRISNQVETYSHHCRITINPVLFFFMRFQLNMATFCQSHLDSQGRELLGDTDGDGVSMAANGGLTDAEGALSDVNSIYECGGGEAGDLDDTSLSSRASSRFCIFKTRCSPN